jgi:hypothetical protein
MKIISGPDREDWSRADIEVHCDGFSGKIRGQFWKNELADFGKEVRKLLTDLSGEAVLKPIEPNIELTLKGDGKGHVTVTGIAQNHAHILTSFHFQFEIDQTYLKAIADAIDVAGRR